MKIDFSIKVPTFCSFCFLCILQWLTWLTYNIYPLFTVIFTGSSSGVYLLSISHCVKQDSDSISWWLTTPTPADPVWVKPVNIVWWSYVSVTPESVLEQVCWLSYYSLIIQGLHRLTAVNTGILTHFIRSTELNHSRTFYTVKTED